MSKIPASFKGSPQDLAIAMVQRMKILSPNGTNFIYIGDVAPTSNVGPWLKDGTQWWVWDTNTNQYVPQDISASFTAAFVMQNSTPTSTTPPLWLQTTQDATDVGGTVGDPIGWFLWDGTSWVPFSSIVLSGPTANRPSTPAAYQQYYDTDISTFIWFERGQWRTVDGVIGDVKIVTAATLTAALTQNPGWQVFALGTVAWRGRAITQATQDQGVNPVTNLPTASGVPPHAAFDTFGENNLFTTSPTGTVSSTPCIALWHLVKL